MQKHNVIEPGRTPGVSDTLKQVKQAAEQLTDFATKAAATAAAVIRQQQQAQDEQSRG